MFSGSQVRPVPSGQLRQVEFVERGVERPRLIRAEAFDVRSEVVFGLGDRLARNGEDRVLGRQDRAPGQRRALGLIEDEDEGRAPGARDGRDPLAITVAVHGAGSDERTHRLTALAIVLGLDVVAPFRDRPPAGLGEAHVAVVADGLQINAGARLEIVDPAFAPNAAVFPEDRDFRHPAAEGIRQVLVAADHRGRGLDPVEVGLLDGRLAGFVDLDPLGLSVLRRAVEECRRVVAFERLLAFEHELVHGRSEDLCRRGLVGLLGRIERRSEPVIARREGKLLDVGRAERRIGVVDVLG